MSDGGEISRRNSQAVIAATLGGSAEQTYRPHTIIPATEYARLDWARPRFLLADQALRQTTQNLEGYRIKLQAAEYKLKQANQELEPDPAEVCRCEAEAEKWRQAVSVTERVTVPNLQKEIQEYRETIRSAEYRLRKIGILPAKRE